MLVRFCVVGAIHCLFFFSYGNASFGYYINQHRMCQKATYSATTKICEMSESVSLPQPRIVMAQSLKRCTYLPPPQAFPRLSGDWGTREHHSLRPRST